MDIESFVEGEAPKASNDDVHDIAYAKALRGAYEVYKDMPLDELKEWQVVSRKQYASSNATHRATASCMVLYKLIEELQLSLK